MSEKISDIESLANSGRDLNQEKKELLKKIFDDTSLSDGQKNYFLKDIKDMEVDDLVKILDYAKTDYEGLKKSIIINYAQDGINEDIENIDKSLKELQERMKKIDIMESEKGDKISALKYISDFSTLV